jgi:photosystem II Psb27 protein
MKRYLSGLLALILVAILGLTSCTASSSGLTGNYRDDTLAVVNTMRAAIDLTADSSDRASIQQQVRQQMNDYASRYRRSDAVLKLQSYTTMRTALNGLAGHYSSYPNRPIPKKLKERLTQELNQIELALKRGG